MLRIPHQAVPGPLYCRSGTLRELCPHFHLSPLLAMQLHAKYSNKKIITNTRIMSCYAPKNDKMHQKKLKLLKKLILILDCCLLLLSDSYIYFYYFYLPLKANLVCLFCCPRKKRQNLQESNRLTIIVIYFSRRTKCAKHLYYLETTRLDRQTKQSIKLKLKKKLHQNFLRIKKCERTLEGTEKCDFISFAAASTGLLSL